MLPAELCSSRCPNPSILRDTVGAEAELCNSHCPNSARKDFRMQKQPEMLPV